MDFIEYLKSKKIDPIKFKDHHPDQYVEWFTLFNQVHPNSFTQQKLFLINDLRRKYGYHEKGESNKPAGAKMMKPKMKPLKPKTK